MSSSTNFMPQSGEQGLLDLSVAFSTRNITAGSDFALFVLVKNPFRVPVYIHEVNVSLPGELRLAIDADLVEMSQQKQAELDKQAETHKQELADLERRLWTLTDELAALNAELATNSSNNSDNKAWLEAVKYRVESLVDHVEEQMESGKAVLYIENAKVETVKVGSNRSTLYIGREGAESNTEIKNLEVFEPWLVQQRSGQTRTIKLRSSLPDGAALQPASTAVYTAVLNVKRSLIFMPSQYRLQFNVNYSFARIAPDAEPERASIFTNIIAQELMIRPSIYSILLGSIAGGLTGAIARMLQLELSLVTADALAALLIAVILTGMSIIFMARKSETQSFVSVEDFWGGLLIGFLVGYTGTAFFESVTGFPPLSLD